MTLDCPTITPADWQASRAARLAAAAFPFEPEPMVQAPRAESYVPSRWVAVRCIDTGERFQSVAQAALAHGVCQTGIRRAIAHGHLCAGRRYARVGRAAKPVPQTGRPQRKVKCIETGQVWPSCMALARELSTHSMAVTRACRKSKEIGGRHYMYARRSAAVTEAVKGAA